MTDPPAEARLRELLRAEHTHGYETHQSDCTACYVEACLGRQNIALVALDLAEALRRAALGQEPQVRGYHEPLCDQCCGCAARKALDRWDTLTKELSDD